MNISAMLGMILSNVQMHLIQRVLRSIQAFVFAIICWQQYTFLLDLRVRCCSFILVLALTGEDKTIAYPDVVEIIRTASAGEQYLTWKHLTKRN